MITLLKQDKEAEDNEHGNAITDDFKRPSHNLQSSRLSKSELNKVESE